VLRWRALPTPTPPRGATERSGCDEVGIDDEDEERCGFCAAVMGDELAGSKLEEAITCSGADAGLIESTGLGLTTPVPAVLDGMRVCEVGILDAMAAGRGAMTVGVR